MFKLLFIAFLLVTSFSVGAQSCVGKWITVDDKTYKRKSVVELYKKEGKLFGKILYLFPGEGVEENPTCTKCTGSMKDKLLVGLRIVRNLKWNGSVWKEGKITDPEEGKDYTVKMWLTEGNPDILNVRGYIGPFYRTQVWVRLKEEDLKKKD